MMTLVKTIKSLTFKRINVGMIQKMFHAIVIVSLSSCAFVPGMSANKMLDKYEEEPKKKQPSEFEDIKIKRIDAYLIREMEAINRGYDSPPKASINKKKPYVYRLGVGDVLSIIVWDHPELTIPEGSFRSAQDSGTVVGQDGTIFFPYAGRIKVVGKTLREVQESLSRRLSKYIENVQLDIRIAAYRSQRVYINGEVKVPGVQNIDDIRPTILEMVNRAGGFNPEANENEVILTRGTKTYEINLRELYEKGSSKNNIELIAGDIVHIPNSLKSKVFVLGEVLKPGGYLLNKGKKTLADALSDASGANQLTADTGQIYVMRNGAEGEPQIYHLDASSPEAMLLADRFKLYERDIVYVDTAEIVRWNRLLSNLVSTANILDNTQDFVNKLED